MKPIVPAITLLELTERVVDALELVGILVIALGTLLAAVRFVVRLIGPRSSALPLLRVDLARAILLGLEVLVAADIVSTAVVDRTLESLGALALLVTIRIVLSFSISIEIDGIVPWRRWRLEQPRQAQTSARSDAAGPAPNPERQEEPAHVAH